MLFNFIRQQKRVFIVFFVALFSFLTLSPMLGEETLIPTSAKRTIRKESIPDYLMDTLIVDDQLLEEEISLDLVNKYSNFKTICSALFFHEDAKIILSTSNGIVIYLFRFSELEEGECNVLDILLHNFLKNYVTAKNYYLNLDFLEANSFILKLDKILRNLKEVSSWASTSSGKESINLLRKYLNKFKEIFDPYLLDANYLISKFLNNEPFTFMVEGQVLCFGFDEFQNNQKEFVKLIFKHFIGLNFESKEDSLMNTRKEAKILTAYGDLKKCINVLVQQSSTDVSQVRIKKSIKKTMENLIVFMNLYFKSF